MANKNFIVKNGLEVGGQEVVSSSGVVTSAALGGQTLASTDSPTFNNLTLTNDIAVGGDINLTGDLNITGDVNSLSVTDLDVTDQTITLGAGQVESASGGSGIVVDGSNASILWDETNDEWDFNKPININGGAEAYNFAANNSITIDNSSGYAAMEMGGSSGAYIDLKNPSSDDYDLRLISFGSGGEIVAAAGSNLLLASSGNSNQLYLNNSGNVGIGTSSPYKKLEVVGDIQLDATDANIWLKSGATGTNGFINWTFNTDDTVFNKIGIDYDTRASTGFHIDAGYPITIDASASGGKAINFDIGGVTKAVIDGTGDLGIGTAGPSSKLHIEDAITGDASQLRITNGAGATLRMGITGSGANEAAHIKTNSGESLEFHIGQAADATTPRVIFDSSGNVGIGVIPSAWDGSMTALQLDTGSIYVNNSGGTYIGANFYYDTTSNTNKYIENNYAAAYGLSNGRHEFYVAGSGTAGNDVSFTEAMRIHSNGKVGIGSDVVSGPAMGLHVGNGIGTLFGPTGSSGSTYISPDHENTINGNYGMDIDNTDLWVNYRGYQNGTTRFRNFKVGQGKEDLIAMFEGSSGNVGIGIANGTSPAAKLEIKQGSSDWYEGIRINRSDNTTQFSTFSNNSGATFISAVDTAGANNNAIVFGNSTNGTTFSEKMRINPDGNVGIGEQSPGSQLQITSNTSGVNSILTIKNAINNRESKLQLIDESNQGGLVLTYDNGGNAAYIGSVISSPLIFNTGNTERMRIDGTDGSVRFKVGAGDSGTNTVNTGSVSMSNTDLDSNTEYTIRSGRYLTSNGTGWETGADGKNPALVIHNDNSATNNRNWPGIIMHNENNTTDAYGPFIGWGAKSASGVYNTTYAWIMGKPVGNGPDSNWRAGELELYTQDTAYVNTKPALRLTQAGLVQKPRLYDANGFFWVRGTSNPSTSGEQPVIFTTLAQAGSGNYSTTTGRYTTPVDGVYHFSANVRIDSASNASSYFRIAFYTGTSPSAAQSGFGQGHSIYGPGSYSTNYFSMQTSWSVHLNANTQVGVVVSLNSGTFEIHQESQFSGHLVG